MRRAPLVLALVPACMPLGPADPPAGEPACLEARESVEPDRMLPLGFRAAEVVGFVRGSHHANLVWPDQSTTPLTLTVESRGAFLVMSRRNPDYKLEIAVECRDHLLLDAAAALVTGDRRLDERWPRADLRSNDGVRAETVVSVPMADVRGSYLGDASQASRDECALRLQFNVTLSSAAFSGTILETVASAPCGAFETTTLVSARRGGSW